MCEDCAFEWRASSTCPYCRAPYDPKSVQAPNPEDGGISRRAEHSLRVEQRRASIMQKVAAQAEQTTRATTNPIVQAMTRKQVMRATIRRMRPSATEIARFSEFGTAYRQQLQPGNVLYTTSRTDEYLALIKCDHPEMTVYVWLNLRGNILPAAAALYQVIFNLPAVDFSLISTMPPWVTILDGSHRILEWRDEFIVKFGIHLHLTLKLLKMIPKTPNKNFRSRPSLAFDLTPPDPKSPRAEVSPTTFLLHLPIDPIKEKTTLDSLEDIVPQNFLLDPPPITADKTILEYYHRILEASSPFAKSREKLKITMPLPRKLISLSKENANLSLNNTGLFKENATLEERLGQLALELKRQAEENDSRWQKQLWRNDDVDSRHHDQQVINTRFNVDIDHVRTAQVDNHADYVKWRRGRDPVVVHPPFASMQLG
ncbi:MAG: hypothetical protein Q9172_003539 [Xanthocarpia lactea]